MASQPNDHLLNPEANHRPPGELDDGITGNESEQLVEAPKQINLPYSFAKRHGVLLDHANENGLALIHRPGVSNMALLEARRAAGRPVAYQRVDEDEFDLLLTRNYEGNTSDAMTVMDDFDGELINAMLTEAIRKGASDVHIEPFEHRLSVRYRVDGVMNKLLEPPQQAAAQVISRIKVMAKLDIAEKRLPQDGRISLRVAGRPVDVRVSTLPSGHGERVVMRLLDKQAHVGRIKRAAAKCTQTATRHCAGYRPNGFR